MNISVLIPTYNNSHFLPCAVESVLSQTLRPLEVIVADDGSTDDTAEVVAQYGKDVRYLRFPHGGVYTVRRAALQEVRGDWFFNLDADNFVEPDFLERAAACIAETASDTLAFIYPDRITFGDYERLQPAPEFSMERFKLGNYVDMNSVIRTDVARSFGFDPAFNSGWGDYDFFLTLAKNGWTGRRMQDTLLHYRVHNASLTAGTAAMLTKRKLMESIIGKHRDFFSDEEAAAALARFSPEAAIRLKFSQLLWSRRYGAACIWALRSLFIRPFAFLSPAALIRALRGTSR